MVCPPPLALVSARGMSRTLFAPDSSEVTVENLGLFVPFVQVTLLVRNPPANVGDTGDMGLIPGLGRSPREENGYPLQYSCPENSIDRGAWQATVHGVTKSWT